MEVGIAIYSSLSNAMEVVNMLQQSICSLTYTEIAKIVAYYFQYGER